MIKNILTLTVLFFFSACGGGGSDSNTPTEENTTIQGLPNNNIDSNISIEDTNSTEDTVIALLNSIRANSGLNIFSSNISLSNSSLNHAKYLVENNLSTHDEISTNLLYTGDAPGDRVIYTGYKSSFVLENLSTGQNDINSSLDGLMSAIYHRFGFLDFNINEMGYGIENNAYVYNMGNSNLNNLCNENNFTSPGTYYYGVCAEGSFRIQKDVYESALTSTSSSNPPYVIYPYDNQSQVTPVFYEESPDPLPNHSVSGYPISIEFNGNDFNMSLFSRVDFSLKSDESSITLINDNNSSSYMVSQNNDWNNKFTEYQFAIFPEARLDYNTSYNVVFSYDYNGTSYSIPWDFHTKSLNNLIKFNNEDLTIKSNVDYFIYFAPNNSDDVITNILYSCIETMDVDYSFYDQNTIKIKIIGDTAQSCSLTLNNNTNLKITLE